MKPIVLIPSDVKMIGLHPYHVVGEKYINAASHGTGAMPLLLPALGEGMDMPSLASLMDLDQILDLVSGIMLTGSVSNVDPIRYGEDRPEGMEMDLQRDDSVFPLLERALDRRMPVLAVCRGIQELNVALGGTLHRRIHEVPGYNDHREPEGVPREEMYGPAHDVEILPGGRLETIFTKRKFRVNSLHGQGIKQVGPRARTEAIAPDGVIEAISCDSHFVVGVQWHPEWEALTNPESRELFAAFGDAMREYAGHT
ncbi:MAG: gamma-glutamyl-gamma-aminobutyrate hydrolase family protein [Pseudomonadales bacterium]|nr:gamma-glutamyl-gamma-aminobutyrate hydrolase family protein [Pseudomonadales bacterium]